MTNCRLEQLQPERMKAAIRTGCIEANVHLTCSYPECRCKHMPVAIKAAIAGWIAAAGRDTAPGEKLKEGS